MTKEKAKEPQLRFKGFTNAWEQRKLGEVADKVTEKNINNKYTETLTNSAEYGIINQREFFDKDISNAKSLNGYYVVCKDDFVYNPRISNFAPVGPIKRNKLGRIGVMSPLYYVFRTKGIDKTFLEHYFDTTHWHKFMKLNGDSGARADRFAIKDSVFKEMPLPYPKFDEQQKIGMFLENLSNLITLHQRKCDLLCKAKKTLLQKMFPKNGETTPEIRFKGFTGAWEQRKLGEVTKRVRGNDGRMNLPTLTISAGTGWLDQCERFSGNIAGAEQKNYTLLHKGELSYNHGNSKLAKYGAVFELRTFEEALVPRVYHSFKTTDEAVPDFIEYMFATKKPNRELGKLVSSGARMDGLLNINYDDFMGIKTMLPSVTEQEKISEFLRGLDHLITLHQHELEKLQNIKQSCLKMMFV